MHNENIRENQNPGKLLMAISIFSALLFIVLLPEFHPYPYSYLLKIIPLLSLGTLVALKLKGTNRILILLALIFCMTGDVLLDLDRSANFQMALIAFLTGHLFYILVFFRDRKFSVKQLPYLLGIVIYTLVVGFILKDISREFIVPVMAYLAVISVMTLSAFLMKNGSWFLRIGALIFMFSDTIIAVNKFLMPIPNSTFFNIGLYFIAQILIVSGLIRANR